MTKRLFIFAGYDRDGIVDETLLYYLNHLSGLGDIVFTMDTDLPDSELAKIQEIPHVLHATAKRHGEYDFGSYKRGYAWARDNKLLNKYDWVYLVNDSVFGPLFDLTPALNKLESNNSENAFGMIGLHTTREMIAKYPTHVQSWFVGVSKPVSNADWFADFLGDVQRQESKDAIVWKYEVGLNKTLVAHGVNIGVFERGFTGTDVYSELIPNFPFLKKLAVKNVPCMKSLYDNIAPDFAVAIKQCVKRCKLRTGSLFKWIKGCI